MKRGLSIIIRVSIRLLVILVCVFALLILYLTGREYKPADTENLTVESDYAGINPGISPGTNTRVVIWNIGYGALGESADFFMDYGKMVYTADTEGVQTNMNGICDTLNELGADIVLLQEVDTDSSRSHHIDETELLGNLYSNYDRTFAYNYKVDYVPYPIPPIGKVGSGIMTLSRYHITSAERIQLPCPFKWPVRIANLKRCLSVNRIAVEGSDRELVIINLHLEAFDDGEGKEAQTRALAEFIDREIEAGNYVIAAGDFNQTFSRINTYNFPEYPDRWHPGRIEESSFNSSLSFYQDIYHPSGRSLDQPYDTSDKKHFQFYVIDGFIVSPGIEVISSGVIDKDFKYSDHNPMVLEFRITE